MEDQPGYPTHRPNKRLKTSETLVTVQQKSLSTTSSTIDKSMKQNANAPAAGLSTQILPPELCHIQAKYDFTALSIISSSKIEQKVRNLLLRLEKFSFADINAKPGVIALHAKASVATKLISIVEITKKAIEKEGGKWWQYSRLHGEITELKEKRGKTKNEGRTLLEWEGNQAAAVGIGLSEASSGNVSAAIDAEVEPEEEEEEEDGVAFETMKNKKATADVKSPQQANVRKKVRAIPVIIIYMSRVPIPDFKGLYGYVLWK